MDANNTIPFAGIFSGIIFAVAIVGVLFLINRVIRRWMKRTGDDARIENKLDGGDTLHAEGVYGTRHNEEGGIHLRQENKKSSAQQKSSVSR
ncbi:MAG: hypothetical protein EOP04_06670 [Proteobacteria bacterium]|nr:MAG: hypothetical protein EOP04_06670 [Pseudomonadota bacterium]